MTDKILNPQNYVDIYSGMFERLERTKFCLAYCGEACDCGIREQMEEWAAYWKARNDGTDEAE